MVSIIPLIVVLILAPTPPKFISILTAASLQLSEPFLVAHTPDVVGNTTDGSFFPLQLAQMA